MKVLFYLNKSLKETAAAAEKSREILAGAGAVITENIDDDYDYAVVFGGDGTIISAVKELKRIVPIIGVNTGNVGYLTAFSESEISALADIGSLTFTKHGCTECRKNGEYMGYCLNDFILSRDFEGGICDINVDLDGEDFSYRADGIIISTATGSTAYAYSAGGPIIEHGTECNVLTPICPHSGFSRSMVISPDREITVKARSREDMYLLCDGKKVCPVTSGDVLTFKVSPHAAFLCDGGHRFYEIVKNKLL